VQLPPSNVDRLALFAEDERDKCLFCGEKTCVTVPEAHASFCFTCDAVCLNGERIDVDRESVVAGAMRVQALW